MSQVIDTNVPLVAKQNEGRPPDLIAACETLLAHILERRLPVVTDADGEIVEEYMHQLSLSGQPSLGDAFVRYVHDHRFTWDDSMRPDILPHPEHANSYAVLNGDDSEIDPSDRKFVAAAKVTGAPVVQATDTKWLDWGPVLSRHGVTVLYAHEASIRQAYRDKFGREAP